MSNKLLDVVKSIFENCAGEVLAALIIFILILCKKFWWRWRNKHKFRMETIVWSPRNKEVCFIITNNGKWELSIYEIKSETKIKIEIPIAEGQIPEWSPDGEKIAFVSAQEGNKEIYIVNADGSNLRRITDDPAEDICPQWSADGTKITYFTRRNGTLIIKTVDITEKD